MTDGNAGAALNTLFLTRFNTNTRTHTHLGLQFQDVFDV